MGNYFSEMNCIKATVITETNKNQPYFDEVEKDENIPEEVKEPNPICDKKEFCDIEDCCKNKELCDKKDCPMKDCCNKKEELVSK
jgi:hypothetical protein